MSYDFTGEPRYYKAVRKPHECVYCGQTIEKGESATYSFGKWQGYIQSSYLCDTCNTIHFKLGLDWSNGIGEFWNDVETWLYEAGIMCPHCEKDNFTLAWEHKTHTLDIECNMCGTAGKIDLFEILGIKE
jgi:Zn ribbon nucleic-acid-binding protein